MLKYNWRRVALLHPSGDDTGAEDSVVADTVEKTFLQEGIEVHWCNGTNGAEEGNAC